MVWSNAVGVVIFGIENSAAFASRDPLVAQIARLAATLPGSGQERLERLRGFGAGYGRALMCACSRFATPDGQTAVLIAATEAAGPMLSLHERVRRLFAEGGEAASCFAPDGTLLHANAAARESFGGATTVSALALDALTASAFKTGSATGKARVNQGEIAVTAIALGQDESRVLLVMPQPPSAALADAAARQAAPSSHAMPEASAPSSSVATTADPSTAGQSASEAESGAERRYPLRFVWHMDVEGRFAIGSDEFIELVGPRTIAACGRYWSEISADLNLDPDDQVARAVATRETWSGLLISWPVDESAERLPIELSGLPVFDRDRVFGGYRGFGVCRDVARISHLSRARRARPIGFAPARQQPPAPMSLVAAPPPEKNEIAPPVADSLLSEEARSTRSSAANVVPFPAGAQPEPKPPSLSPVERKAFRELAQELTARLRGPQPEAARAPGEHHVADGASAAGTDAESPAPSEPAGGDHALLDRMPVGVLVHRNDTLLYANRHFLELTGYGSLEALAAAGGLHVLFAEPDASAADALTDGGAAQSLSIATSRGEQIPVEGRLLTWPWNGGSALALTLTSRRLEEQQRTAQIALDAGQKEIGDLKAILERTARREAQKAAATKAEFLSKISHEIRTPLNSIIGFAEVIMAERFGSIGNERYREYLKDMHAAGTHLVSLLNDLLDLSKIETGQLDLTFADVDLNHLTQQCVDIMQPQANRARIIIRTALTSGLPLATADARSLRQIVLNLLGNAIKFTGPGGQVIVSSAVADNDEVLLRVRDTSAGMAEADIEAVFDPFRQTAASAGMGLGLPLTKALAEANRGKFSIKSAPNAGTLVEIALPSNRVAAR